MQSLFKAKEGVSGYDHLQSLRSHLAKCGVTSGGDNKKEGEVVLEMQNVPAGALSGGQRSRVAMAAVSYVEPHLLVLDEPTNNLDLESVAALAESVKSFEGAVICVSHDQHFVEAISNEAWVVGGKEKVVERVESFRSYKNAQMRALVKGRGGAEQEEEEDAPIVPIAAPSPVPEPVDVKVRRSEERSDELIT
jgi:ATP-binding cassette subfamily F protein 3